MGIKCKISGVDYEFEKLRPADLFKAAKWLKEHQLREFVGDIAFSPLALVPEAIRSDTIAKMIASNVGRQEVLRSDQGRMYLVFLACKPPITFEQWTNTITPEEYEQLELIAFRLANIKIEEAGEDAPLVNPPDSSSTDTRNPT